MAQQETFLLNMTLCEFVIYLKSISCYQIPGQAEGSKIGWDIPTEWAYSVSTVEIGLRYVNSCLKMAVTIPKRPLMFCRAWIH